jgi:hypothetical protein
LVLWFAVSDFDVFAPSVGLLSALWFHSTMSVVAHLPNLGAGSGFMSAFSSQSMADSMQVDFVDLLGLQSNSLPLIQFQDCDFPTVDDILSAAVVTTETPVPCAGKSKSTTNQPNKSRRKREVKKKQPDRANFASDQEYTVAWEAWRLARVKNNESVKRSREKARECSAESKK